MIYDIDTVEQRGRLVERFFSNMSEKWKEAFMCTQNIYNYNCAGFALGTFNNDQFPMEHNEDDSTDWDGLITDLGGHQTAFTQCCDELVTYYGATFINENELHKYAHAIQFIMEKHDFHFLVKIGDTIIGKAGFTPCLKDVQIYNAERGKNVLHSAWFVLED